MHIVEQNFKDFVETLKGERFFIAYSGGVDSEVLLHLAAKYLPNKVTALHVNHGISVNANDWERKCRSTAKLLDVEFDVARFSLREEKGNVEEIARELRYDFFQKAMNEDDVIFTGHHLDDQAETFMLRLMRGSGVDGLASIAPIRPLSKGVIARPLLNVSKEEIYDYAKEMSMNWVEDESNKSSDYDRNFIRNEVLPLLKTRWNKASHLIARSAKHCGEVKETIAEKSDKLLEDVMLENKLEVSKIEKLEKPDQKMVLRAWLKSNKALMPPEKTLDVILNEVVFSRADSKSCFSTQNYEIKKSFGLIYFVESGNQLEFEVLKGCVKETETSSHKMKYKGTMRTFKYIMKAERIPQWERKHYFASMKDNVVLAFGDIKKS